MGKQHKSRPYRQHPFNYASQVNFPCVWAADERRGWAPPSAAKRPAHGQSCGLTDPKPNQPYRLGASNSPVGRPSKTNYSTEVCLVAREPRLRSLQTGAFPQSCRTSGFHAVLAARRRSRHRNNTRRRRWNIKQCQYGKKRITASNAVPSQCSTSRHFSALSPGRDEHPERSARIMVKISVAEIGDKKQSRRAQRDLSHIITRWNAGREKGSFTRLQVCGTLPALPGPRPLLPESDMRRLTCGVNERRNATAVPRSGP